MISINTIFGLATFIISVVVAIGLFDRIVVAYRCKKMKDKAMQDYLNNNRQ